MAVRPAQAPVRGPERTAASGLARCARVLGGPLPSPVRTVLRVGGFRVLVAGLDANSRPLCTGACAPLDMTLALVDGDGSVCFRAVLPDEHRLGPVASPGRTVFVSGPRRVHAVGWDGRRLATTVAEGLVGEPVSLADGGAAFLDAAGHVLAFRPDGSLRYRRRPETPAAPLALAPRPGGGVLVAFEREVRGYDLDGVETLVRVLPESSLQRVLGGMGPRALWVWSGRGAYRFREDGSLADRLPPRAPADGQLFGAALGPDRVFYALFSERGFHPVKLAAFRPTGAPLWSRPFTGERPNRCRLLPGPKGLLGILCAEAPLRGVICGELSRRRQLGNLCEGELLGRAVVRDREGLTRFDEEVVRPQVAFGPGGAFAVADERQDKSRSWRCRVRRYLPGSDEPRASERAGYCPWLWADGSGTLYLGHERMAR